MVGHTGRFVEIWPAEKVFLNGIGQLANEAADAYLLHQAGHSRNVNEKSHVDSFEALELGHLENSLWVHDQCEWIKLLISPT